MRVGKLVSIPPRRYPSEPSSKILTEGMIDMSATYGATVNHVLETRIDVGSSWTQLNYSGSGNALGRRYLGVFNRSDKKAFYTTDSSANVKYVRALAPGEYLIFPYSDKVTLYARTSTGTARLVVTEEIT